MGKSITKNIWSMIVINLAILITTLTLHELGHAITGRLAGCVSAKAIIYDSSSPNPYTELLCEHESKPTYLAGLVFTTIFGLSFLFFDNKPQKMFSLIVIGFGIFLSALDMVELTQMTAIKYLFIFIGLTSLIIGQVIYGILNAKETIS
ncbi:MAG: hypothetical protein NZ893_02480 [Candidatus Aenigmarchaeota archaeon]|nr:hypothetical protein [Candidatus Aenigmarchaeota archaeon]